MIEVASQFAAWSCLLASDGGPLSHVLPHEVFRVGGQGIANQLQFTRWRRC